MKKILLTLLTLALAAGAANAAKYYGFKIGGVNVTTDNFQNITGTNIGRYATDMKVSYDPNTNTVTLHNVSISRTGKDNRAILNESCEGLTVKFTGTNKLAATDASPVRFNTSGKLTCADGGRAIITGGTQGGIFVNKDATLSIVDADIEVTGTSCIGIEGDGDEQLSINNSIVKVNGSKGALAKFRYLFVSGNSIVTFDTEVNGVTTTTPTVSDLVGYSNYDNIYVTTPNGGSFNTTRRTFMAAGIAITGKMILSETKPRVEINTATFPDPGVRNALYDTPEGADGVFTGEELLAIRYLNLNNRSISNATGIECFNRLTELNIGNNQLTTLSIVPFKELQTLICGNNKLTHLTMTGSNTKLNRLLIEVNRLNGADMDAIVNVLPDLTGTGKTGELVAYDNDYRTYSEVDLNFITPEQAAKVKAKGWNIRSYYVNDLGWRYGKDITNTGMIDYKVSVGGYRVHNCNADYVRWAPGTLTGKVTYDGDRDILTLDGADINTSAAAALYCAKQGLIVTVRGKNKLTAPAGRLGINLVENHLVQFSGGGTLTLGENNNFSLTTAYSGVATTTLNNVTLEMGAGSSIVLDDSRSHELDIVGSTVHLANGHIDTPVGAMTNCYLSKPANGTFMINGFLTVDGNPFTGEIEILPGKKPEPVGKRGDVNGDGLVDLEDMNIVINIMLKKDNVATWPQADINGDGLVDLDDMNSVINIMLKKE